MIGQLNFKYFTTSTKIFLQETQLCPNEERRRRSQKKQRKKLKPPLKNLKRPPLSVTSTSNTANPDPCTNVTQYDLTSSSQPNILTFLFLSTPLNLDLRVSRLPTMMVKMLQRSGRGLSWDLLVDLSLWRMISLLSC